MNHLITAAAIFAAAATLLGCGGEQKPGGPTPGTDDPSTATAPAPAPAPAAAPAPAPAPAATPANGGSPGADSHTGPSTDLGAIVIEGSTLTVKQFGELEAGDHLAADVTGEIPAGASLFAWIADAAGTPLGATSNSELTNGTWHFHLAQDESDAAPVWLYLRIRGGGKDARARLLLAGATAPPPHGGVTGGILPAGDDAGTDPVGTIEALWDPATGTLSLWFYKGTGYGTPMPIDAAKGVVALLDDAPLELEIKDAAAGHAVKAGEDGLKDGDLTPMITAMFTSGGIEYTTELLVLEHR